MARKGKKHRGGGKRRRLSRRGAVVSITGVIGILILLNRLGVVTSAFWSALQAGNLGNMVLIIEQSLAQNFSVAGIGVTIGIFIAYAIITFVVKFAMRGKTIPLRGKPRALAA